LPTVTDSDTTLTDGTVQVLTDVTDNKYFTFKLNTTNMASGDTVVLKIYDKVLNTSTLALVTQETYTDAQTLPIKFLPPQWITEEIKITLQRTAGTDRNYEWALLEND